MKIAIIDLGTNSCKLFIVKLHENKRFQLIYKNKLAVKLLNNINSKSEISSEIIEKTLLILDIFKKRIDENNVNIIRAFATSGIRSAKNGIDIIQEINKQIGINFEIISGDREAELIYNGIKQAVPMTDENVLMMDIGGGSTEFLIANKNQIHWKHSFNLGASRLFNYIKPSDPINENEIIKLTNYLENELNLLFEICKKYEIHQLIGSSGFFKTLAKVLIYQVYDPIFLRNKTYFEIPNNDILRLHQQFLKATLEDLKNTKGIPISRADLMVTASILLEVVIRKLNIKRVIQSDFSLKEGVLLEI